MNSKNKSDGLSEAIEKLQTELNVIQEELRVIDLRKPALELRVGRITEALSSLTNDVSRGDSSWRELPRITGEGLGDSKTVSIIGEAIADVNKPRKATRRARSAKTVTGKKAGISQDVIMAMVQYIRTAKHPLKSSELYEHLVATQKIEPIETEMPYKSFAITLRHAEQDHIQYNRNSKTWTVIDHSPKAKLREALEKGDGTRVISSHSLPTNRKDHLFVKVLTDIFHDNHANALNGIALYDDLSERREFGLIPGVESFTDFTATLAAYNDFFSFDKEAAVYRCIVQKTDPKPEVINGVQGLYVVKQPGRAAV